MDDKTGYSNLYGKGGEITIGDGSHGTMPDGMVKLWANGATLDTGIVASSPQSIFRPVLRVHWL